MQDGRPTHIDIPPAPEPSSMEEGATSPRSSTRPAPTRGILKNPLRRPSYMGDEEPKTDEERQEPEQGGRARVNEQYVLSRFNHAMWIQGLELTCSGLTWDEANIALTEIQKDSLMLVHLFPKSVKGTLTRLGRLTNPRLHM